MPFLDLLKERSSIINLSSMDYRLLNTEIEANYFHPLNHETKANVDKTWDALTSSAGSSEGEKGEERTVTVA
jgi:predicted ATPase